jgi:hypothetical protein
MRTIGVSTVVYAAIWALRQEGEETEDAILRRILKADPLGKEKPPQFAQDGFKDERSKTHFPEGFEIFRSYKGKEVRARATRGRWLLLKDSSTHSSLHKLSSAVVAGNENAWQNWKYLRHDGTEALIARLRTNDSEEQQ